MRSAEEGTRLGVVRPGGHVANVGVPREPATLHLEDLWIKMARRVESGDRVTGDVGRRLALRRGELGVTLEQAAERACVAPGLPAHP